MHVQANLRSGTTVRTCWLQQGVRVGNQVTLKNSEEPERLWDVTWVGSKAIELSDLNRGWNNNI